MIGSADLERAARLAVLFRRACQFLNLQKLVGDADVKVHSHLELLEAGMSVTGREAFQTKMAGHGLVEAGLVGLAGSRILLDDSGLQTKRPRRGREPGDRQHRGEPRQRAFQLRAQVCFLAFRVELASPGERQRRLILMRQRQVELINLQLMKVVHPAAQHQSRPRLGDPIAAQIGREIGQL